MEEKGKEFDERYKDYKKESEESSETPLMLLIKQGASFLGELENVYKRIDVFHEKNIAGKILNEPLRSKERVFLEKLYDDYDLEFWMEAESSLF